MRGSLEVLGQMKRVGDTLLQKLAWLEWGGGFSGLKTRCHGHGAG
jgi:hypothetical protein